MKGPIITWEINIEIFEIQQWLWIYFIKFFEIKRNFYILYQSFHLQFGIYRNQRGPFVRYIYNWIYLYIWKGNKNFVVIWNLKLTKGHLFNDKAFKIYISLNIFTIYKTLNIFIDYLMQRNLNQVFLYDFVYPRLYDLKKGIIYFNYDSILINNKRLY